MEAYKDQQRIWAARQRKKVWEPLFARAFRNRTPGSTSVGQTTGPVAQAPAGPLPEPGGVSPTRSTPGADLAPAAAPAAIVGQEADAAEAPGTTNSAPEDSGARPEEPLEPDFPGPSKEEIEEEYEGPATTEDVENVLGNYPDAKTRMKILLRQGEPREPTPEELTEERIAILSAPLEA